MLTKRTLTIAFVWAFLGGLSGPLPQDADTGIAFCEGGRDLLRRQQLTGIVTRESATFAWIRRVHRRNAAGKTRLDGGLLKRCHFGL